MTVSEIIKQVRWCVDEESGYQDYEDTYFDNIIKSKIGVALRWCAMFADVSLLNDGTKNSLTKDVVITCSAETKHFDLPSDVLRITRVRVSNWHKAVMSFIAEDSSEYLLQSDETGKGTYDRPVAALIATTPTRIELYPAAPVGATISYSVIYWPSIDTSTTTSDVPIPSKLEGAFIYYLAFLVMTAHCDMTKANAMLAIAKQHLSLTVDE